MQLWLTVTSRNVWIFACLFCRATAPSQLHVSLCAYQKDFRRTADLLRARRASFRNDPKVQRKKTLHRIDTNRSGFYNCLFGCGLSFTVVKSSNLRIFANLRGGLVYSPEPLRLAFLLRVRDRHTRWGHLLCAYAELDSIDQIRICNAEWTIDVCSDLDNLQWHRPFLCDSGLTVKMVRRQLSYLSTDCVLACTIAFISSRHRSGRAKSLPDKEVRGRRRRYKSIFPNPSKPWVHRVGRHGASHPSRSGLLLRIPVITPWIV